MNVEVAICTWNRAALLRQTLESIVKAKLPDDCHLRIIVVNNNSRDSTDAVVRDCTGNCEVHLVHEPRQGHTICRNRAIGETRGDLLVWTDDDVLVDRRWLTAYVDAARSNPNHSFWGGPIHPEFDPRRPHWIDENWQQLKGCFAERDLGTHRSDLTLDTLPYGANFAIRTNVQQEFPFDEDLGRRGTRVLGEDELDLFRRLLSAGHSGGWVAEAPVQHVITEGRATERYVSDYFVGQGRALVARGNPWTTNRFKLRIQSLVEFFLYRSKRHFASSPAWTAHMIRGALAKGQYQALAESQ